MRDFQMKQQNTNNEWEKLYPITKGENVLLNTGGSLQDFINSVSLERYIQTGRHHMTGLEADVTATDRVVFPHAFKGKPIVVVTYGSQAVSRLTPAGITSVDKYGFNLHIRRSNTTSTYVTWIAVYLEGGIMGE